MTAMPTFYHAPSDSYLTAETHAQANRYRRNHRFIEVDRETLEPIDPLQTIAFPESGPVPPLVDQDTTETVEPILIEGYPQDGTVAEILKWAGTDTHRRQAARIIELADKNRKTLLSKLR